VRRRWLAGAATWLASKAAIATVKARAWHLHAAVPGFAGAGLVSAGLGLKFGVWAALIVAGGFLLRLDSRL
jgi:hypothetical protein